MTGRFWIRCWIEARREWNRKRRMRPTVLWIGRLQDARL